MLIHIVVVSADGVGFQEGVPYTPVSLVMVMQVIGGTGILMVVVLLSAQVEATLSSAPQPAEMLPPA